MTRVDKAMLIGMYVAAAADVAIAIGIVALLIKIN